MFDDLIINKEKQIKERMKERMKILNDDEEDEEETPEEWGELETEGMQMAPVAYAPELTIPSSGGVKIIFKNAKVYAEKVIIKKK